MLTEELRKLSETSEVYAGLFADAADEIDRLNRELNTIKEEFVEYVHDGGEFNWTEAVILIRGWRERAEQPNLTEPATA